LHVEREKRNILTLKRYNSANQNLEEMTHQSLAFSPFTFSSVRLFLIITAGGSRGTSDNCVEEQKRNYLLRKTKLKAIFALLSDNLVKATTLLTL